MLELLLGIGTGEITPYIPGSATLTSGDKSAGYYSTVTAAELITPSILCNTVGLTVGTLINSDSDWVKMSYLGKTLFYSKKNIRSSISWNILNTLGLVAGNKIITIHGMQYRCRIMHASSVDPYTQGAIANPSQMLGTEYTHMVLRMCSVATTVEVGSKLGSFTANALGLLEGINMVTNSNSTDANNVISVGGATNVSQVLPVAKATASAAQGWRAVLELVEPPPTIPNNGPGPAELLQYDSDNNVGYFGTMPLSDLFTIEAIEAIAVTALPGAAINRDVSNYWIKTFYKGKILYMPRKIVRSGVTWNDIYNAGFIYGIDGPGKTPPVAGSVNQLRTITKTAQDGTVVVFKVRAIQTYAVDPFTNTPVTGEILNTEYSMLRERLSPTSGNPITWAMLGPIGGQTPGPESSNYSSGGRSFNVGGNNVYLYRQALDKTVASNFYPVLEIVSITRP